MKEEYAQSALLCIEGIYIFNCVINAFKTLTLLIADTPTPTTKLDDASDDGVKCITKRFNASLPPDYVPDSESAEVSVTGLYTFILTAYHTNIRQ